MISTSVRNTSSFWGWSNVSFAYRGGEQAPCLTDWKSGDTLDCMLDQSTSGRTFRVLNRRSSREVVLSGLPMGPVLTNPAILWTPHFNAFATRLQMICEPIYPSMYGTALTTG